HKEILKKREDYYFSLDVKTGDTLTNTIEVRKYKGDKIYESRKTDFVDPKRNRKRVYKYKRGLISKAILYNFNKQLISETKYEYKFDKHNAWVERLSLVNEKPNDLIVRTIYYR
ncbi:MAG: hypothetical protein AAGA77_24565, partial [Bacteroidota bacterium]